MHRELYNPLQGSQFLKSLEEYTLFLSFLEKSGNVWQKSGKSLDFELFLTYKNVLPNTLLCYCTF